MSLFLLHLFDLHAEEIAQNCSDSDYCSQYSHLLPGRTHHGTDNICGNEDFQSKEEMRPQALADAFARYTTLAEVHQHVIGPGHPWPEPTASLLIALLAAGMAAQAIQFLNSAGLVVALDRPLWDTSWLLSEKSIFGRLLHTLIGYTDQPTEMQLIVYIATLFAMFLLMRVARYSPRERVPAAAE